MTTLQIYLLSTVLPNFDKFLSFIYIPATIVSTVLVITIIIILCDAYDDEDRQKARNIFGYTKYSISVMLIALSIAVFIPSQNQLTTIIAGSYLTQMKGMKDLPPTLVDYLNTVLKAETNKIKEKETK